MERYFVLDKFNTWYDWRLIVTSKDITPPKPKTNYVTIDGMSGTLDLSEALTGEVTFSDRTITATFWTDDGTRKDREDKLLEICSELHGKKIKIIEPDDPAHCFYGRVEIGNIKNYSAYATFTLTATCEPWRYSLEDITRRADVNDSSIDLVIGNKGVKSLCPVIEVDGSVTIAFNGVTHELMEGSYKIISFRLKRGSNIVTVSGTGSVVFRYKEAIF